MCGHQTHANIAMHCLCRWTSELTSDNACLTILINLAARLPAWVRCSPVGCRVGCPVRSEFGQCRFRQAGWVRAGDPPLPIAGQLVSQCGFWGSSHHRHPHDPQPSRGKADDLGPSHDDGCWAKVQLNFDCQCYASYSGSLHQHHVIPTHSPRVKTTWHVGTEET